MIERIQQLMNQQESPILKGVVNASEDNNANSGGGLIKK